MYYPSISVSQSIRDILNSNPLYLDALKSGIANYTALAQKIKPEVERMVNGKVNTGTIVVSIKRIADSLEQAGIQNEQTASISYEGIRMTLTGSIIDIGFTHKEVEKVFNTIDEIFEKEIVFNIVQTDKQFRFFAEDIDDIRNIFSELKSNGQVKSGLSKISIKVQYRQTNDAYNLMSSVSHILNTNHIPLYNAFFSPDEIVLIINDKDAARAYELLRAKFN